MSTGLSHRRVRFRISDVFIPSSRELVADLWGRELLEGEVLQLSESGVSGREYAVVKVAGMQRLVIVPVDRILEVLSS
jgi:hypothetical protein